MERIKYQDPWNELKTWEVTRMSGAFYLKQFIDGKQWGRGQRTTKKWLQHLGILKFETINE